MVDLLDIQRSNLLSGVFRGEYRRRPGGRMDWRVLVLDSISMVTLQNLFTWDQIISENIVRVDNIEDEERTPINFPAIYLLSSERGQAAVLRGLRKEFRGDKAAELFTQELTSSTKFSHHPLVHDAVTATLENLETETGCCLVYLAEALHPPEPMEKDLEEALKEELARYQKNRGGQVFLLGSERVDFTTGEFLETAAAGRLVHQAGFVHPTWTAVNSNTFILESLQVDPVLSPVQDKVQDNQWVAGILASLTRDLSQVTLFTLLPPIPRWTGLNCGSSQPCPNLTSAQSLLCTKIPPSTRRLRPRVGMSYR